MSPEKLLVLGVFAFIVLGPNRLPELARKAGRLLGQARSMSGSLRAEMHEALAEPRDALNSAAQELGLPGGISGIPKVPSVRGLVAGALLNDPNRTAAAPGGPYVDSDGTAASAAGPLRSVGGLPPAPDDPTLN